MSFYWSCQSADLEKLLNYFNGAWTESWDVCMKMLEWAGWWGSWSSSIESAEHSFPVHLWWFEKHHQLHWHERSWLIIGIITWTVCCPASDSSPDLWKCALEAHLASSWNSRTLPWPCVEGCCVIRDRALRRRIKPGPPTNLLDPEKTTALDRKEQNPEVKLGGMKREFHYGTSYQPGSARQTPCAFRIKLNLSVQ